MKRAVFIAVPVLVCLLVVGVWLTSSGSAAWKPSFLAKALEVEGEANTIESGPFRQRIGVNSFQSLGPKGVTFQDYLLEGSFDSVEDFAKKELPPAQGWEQLYTTPTNAPGSFKANEMNALFLFRNRAVTVFRQPQGGKVRVRVWTRTPPIFGNWF
jgi:hypothetical protein